MRQRQPDARPPRPQHERREIDWPPAPCHRQLNRADDNGRSGEMDIVLARTRITREARGRHMRGRRVLTTQAIIRCATMFAGHIRCTRRTQRCDHRAGGKAITQMNRRVRRLVKRRSMRQERGRRRLMALALKKPPSRRTVCRGALSTRPPIHDHDDRWSRGRHAACCGWRHSLSRRSTCSVAARLLSWRQPDGRHRWSMITPDRPAHQHGVYVTGPVWVAAASDARRLRGV